MYMYKHMCIDIHVHMQKKEQSTFGGVFLRNPKGMTYKVGPYKWYAI